jgi:hypothetical protein
MPKSFCRHKSRESNVKQPRIIDNDSDTIFIRLGDTPIRSWNYENTNERLLKMHLAREFVEGWHEAFAHLTLDDIPELMARVPQETEK